MKAGLFVTGKAPQVEYRRWGATGGDEIGDQTAPVPPITRIDADRTRLIQAIRRGADHDRVAGQGNHRFRQRGIVAKH